MHHCGYILMFAELWALACQEITEILLKVALNTIALGSGFKTLWSKVKKQAAIGWESSLEKGMEIVFCLIEEH